MNIAQFLKQFDVEKLRECNILNQKQNLLNGKSVDPLISLMKKNGINKLESRNGWYLDSEYNFSNPKSNESQTGNIIRDNFIRPGTIFLNQNKYINPFYNCNKATSAKFVSPKPNQRTQLDVTVFANEDISKPENRINLSLFGLFLVDQFRKWFLTRLKLPADAVVFPSANLSGVRPDFAVHDKQDNPIAYIEVEIGDEDQAQLKNFRNSTEYKIISITGKPEHNNDLSLLEIYEKLIDLKQSINSSQFNKNIAVFETLIVENVLGYDKNRYPRKTISDHMKKSTIVSNLFKSLPLIEDIEKNLYPGEFAIETRKENGFSLRLYSRNSTIRKSFAVMSQSGGRPQIIFPSKINLYKYLPDKKIKIEGYSKLLTDLGCPIGNLPEKGQGRLKIDIVEKNISSIIEIIRDLGGI
ncbi:hypothetical protein KJ762_12405 [bacterium]|nr:hypothetical protein [bacterium]MBU1635293.1 hypothetical protein [bacterium]MBU1873621.1 hypothetical protein [bacterium]